jgi:hypothetical protein
MAREHRGLHRDLVRAARIQHAADLRVLPFGILADDDEVDVARRLADERTTHARIEHRRSNARILIEPPPNRQQQTVQRDVVLQARVAHGAEENRVERAQPIERVLRHHPTVLEVVLRAPVELLPDQAELKAGRGRLQHPDRRWNHFVSNAVAGNHCYAIGLH